MMHLRVLKDHQERNCVKAVKMADKIGEENTERYQETCWKQSKLYSLFSRKKKLMHYNTGVMLHMYP